MIGDFSLQARRLLVTRLHVQHRQGNPPARTRLQGSLDLLLAVDAQRSPADNKEHVVVREDRRFKLDVVSTESVKKLGSGALAIQIKVLIRLELFQKHRRRSDQFIVMRTFTKVGHLHQ